MHGQNGQGENDDGFVIAPSKNSVISAEQAEPPVPLE
jgi:hypothetical protein